MVIIHKTKWLFLEKLLILVKCTVLIRPWLILKHVFPPCTAISAQTFKQFQPFLFSLPTHYS